MPLLECRQVSKYFGADPLFENIDLVIERGERVGLVGANGSGKTTLCRLILGQDEPDAGVVRLAQGAQVGHLPQTPVFDGELTIRDTAMSAVRDLQSLEAEFAAAAVAVAAPEAEDDPAELERRLAHHSRLLAEIEARGGFDYEQRMLATLGALRFGPGDLERPVSQLSGGEKSRLALAMVLMQGADLLLLDEPTNHLDIGMVEWLEDLLRGFAGGVILVSHDRWFLNNVAHVIADMENGSLSTYRFGEGDAKLPPPDDPEFAAEDMGDDVPYGAYTHFMRVKAERRAAQWKAYLTQQKERQRQEAWIRWKLNLRRESHVRAARSRQKMLEKQELVDRPADEAPVVRLDFEPARRGPDDVAIIDDLAFGYDGDLLFEGLDLHVRRRERIGIVGPNGCGKSSLLRVLNHELQPAAGSARVASTCEVAFYRQEHQDLDLTLTPLQALRQVAPTLPIGQVRGLLARFLFFGDDVFRPLHTFSGGERSRLVLARLILKRPNLLLLDEPTNHLDVASREVLEEALKGYGGTILVVSHDRWFLDVVCRRLVVFNGPEPQVYEGNYSAWQAEREAAREQAARADEADRKARRREHLVREREGQQRRAEKRRTKAQTAEVERRIESLEGELAKLHERYADPDLYGDSDAVKSTQQEEARLRRELDDLYAEWETLLG